MADATFDVVFQGQLIAGADPAQVRANLAKLFKAEPARIEALFSGSTVIKKAVDDVTARHYQAALAKAGAAVTLVATPVAVTPPIAGAVKPAAPAVPQPVTPMTIAEPGVILIEPTVVTPANFDTTSYTLAEVGATLVEPLVISAPQYDLSALTLDPPGTTLVEPSPVPPANIDTSGLSLADS